MEVIQISQELEKKIRQAETVEEVVQACAEEGIQITKEQLEAAMFPVQNGELSEEMLNDVSGGGLFSWVRTVVSAIRYSSGGGGFSSGGGGRGSFGGGGGGGGGR